MDQKKIVLIGGAALAGVAGLYLLTRGGGEDGGGLGGLGGGGGFTTTTTTPLEDTKKGGLSDSALAAWLSANKPPTVNFNFRPDWGSSSGTSSGTSGTTSSGTSTTKKEAASIPSYYSVLEERIPSPSPFPSFSSELEKRVDKPYTTATSTKKEATSLSTKDAVKTGVVEGLKATVPGLGLISALWGSLWG